MATDSDGNRPAELERTPAQAIEGITSVVRGLLSGADRDEVLARYRVDWALLEFKHAPELYGTGVIERIASDLGVSARGLYRCITVAESWSDAEIRDLMDRTTGYGRPLSWSHFLALVPVTDPQLRKVLVEKCLDEAWSSRDLKHEIDHVASGTRGSDGLRPGEAVRAALKEGIHMTDRATLDLRTLEVALRERLADRDVPVDEHLVGLAMESLDGLISRAESTRTQLCFASDSQGRVPVPARQEPVPEEESTDGSDDEVQGSLLAGSPQVRKHPRPR